MTSQFEKIFDMRDGESDLIARSDPVQAGWMGGHSADVVAAVIPRINSDARREAAALSHDNLRSCWAKMEAGQGRNPQDHMGLGHAGGPEKSKGKYYQRVSSQGFVPKEFVPESSSSIGWTTHR
jgi:hypothetical protein